MILGILSDTHGRSQRAGLAKRLLKQQGAEVFVHCGDVGSIEVFEQFSGERFHFVWGNTDSFSLHDLPYIESLGITPPRQIPLQLEYAGKRIGVLHGHEPQAAPYAPDVGVRAVAFSPAVAMFDYVLHGHTHEVRDERRGGTRIINPGALHRAAVYTVSTLDLSRDLLKFWKLDDAVAAPALLEYAVSERP